MHSTGTGGGESTPTGAWLTTCQTLTSCSLLAPCFRLGKHRHKEVQEEGAVRRREALEEGRVELGAGTPSEALEERVESEARGCMGAHAGGKIRVPLHILVAEGRSCWQSTQKLGDQGSDVHEWIASTDAGEGAGTDAGKRQGAARRIAPFKALKCGQVNRGGSSCGGSHTHAHTYKHSTAVYTGADERHTPFKTPTCVLVSGDGSSSCEDEEERGACSGEVRTEGGHVQLEEAEPSCMLVSSMGGSSSFDEGGIESQLCELPCEIEFAMDDEDDQVGKDSYVHVIIDAMPRLPFEIKFAMDDEGDQEDDQVSVNLTVDTMHWLHELSLISLPDGSLLTSS
eukprot:1157515-Pelagomonas_calceolata.AAC.4